MWRAFLLLEFYCCRRLSCAVVHYAIALRAVNTSDFMTADAAQLPWEVLGKVTNRIVNEVKGVNRVMYDCTGKPPATIEFE